MADLKEAQRVAHRQLLREIRTDRDAHVIQARASTVELLGRAHLYERLGPLLDLLDAAAQTELGVDLTKIADLARAEAEAKQKTD